MKTQSLLKGVALVALAVLATGCGNRNSTTTTAEEKKPLVKVSTARIESVAQTEEFSGTILPFSQNNISPSMPLRIQRILVDVGDRVAQGQILAELDQSSLLQAKVQLENLKADLQRYQALYEAGGVSKQQLDQMTTQVDASQVSFDNLQENTVLRSPVAGVVTARNYDPGDLYGSGGAILTVMQIDRVKVQVNISEGYFPQVKVGMPVAIRLDVYPDEVFEGKVSLIYPAVDAATRTFTTEITIPNGNLKLRPGMFARVAINFGAEDQVVVPDVAIQKQVGTNERFGFVIENGVAHRRTLTLGRQVGSSVAILSGFSAGETIVVAGGQKLLDGTEVDVTRE
ncbi:MAG: efflux RND transporter periplasmic adaptor subunit [Rikenellaceae bacterium]|jgi:RND family efflux transporter MFP subunit|nr:efflux RND transporter periplasmic adaptor subunit [Rikenellaceae bacterium]